MTQVIGLGIMIDRCSPDSENGRPSRHPSNVGYSLFMYSNDDLRYHTNRKPKLKVWTREDNQLVLHCSFSSNTTQRGYKKRMIEIRQECSNFQITCQILTDQDWTIINDGWFSLLEMIEMHQKINNQQGNNLLPDISNIKNKKQPNQNKPPTSENGYSNQPNNPEQTLSLEQKFNLEKFQENYEVKRLPYHH